MGLTVDDLSEINQLYAAYCHAVDDGDGKAFSACFSPDGVFDPGGSPMTGSEALADFASGVPAGLPGIRHMVTNILVEGNGDEAAGRAYLTVYHSSDSPGQVLITGRYRDSLRRVSGRWVFTERVFAPDGAPPAA